MLANKVLVAIIIISIITITFLVIKVSTPLFDLKFQKLKNITYNITENLTTITVELANITNELTLVEDLLTLHQTFQ